MKIYYDCEFLENGRTIQLISIGMVDEEGREYYAVNRLMPVLEIARHGWLMENVIPHLPLLAASSGRPTLDLRHPDVKTPRVITTEVRDFVQRAAMDAGDKQAELWAWCGAYDHVALCQLYGTMMALPAGFPHHTNDIEQEARRLGVQDTLPAQEGDVHHALADARHERDLVEFMDGYQRKMNLTQLVNLAQGKSF